jgi:hypothetical protein
MESEIVAASWVLQRYFSGSSVQPSGYNPGFAKKEDSLPVHHDPGTGEEYLHVLKKALKYLWITSEVVCVWELTPPAPDVEVFLCGAKYALDELRRFFLERLCFPEDLFYALVGEVYLHSWEHYFAHKEFPYRYPHDGVRVLEGVFACYGLQLTHD